MMPHLPSAASKKTKKGKKQTNSQGSGYTPISENLVRFKMSARKKMSFHECTCGDNGTNCSDKSCQNRGVYKECTTMCRATDCKNRRFSKKEGANVHVKRVRRKGHGVMASENIYKDGFVGEFVGEIMKYKQFGLRDHRHALCTKQYYYDAKRFGNAMRYLNHSCSPNAECQVWSVPGTPGNIDRLGIFAIKDIAKGEEITIDYAYAYDSAEKCYCGADNCKGVIGGNQNGN